jgi:Flp pilus assembly protein TadD
MTLASFDKARPSGASPRPRRPSGASALAILAALALCGCSKVADVAGSIGDVTGSIGAPRRAELPKSEADLRRYVEDMGRRYDSDPKHKANALAYARGLHALDRNAEAVAVLQGQAIRRPDDQEVLAAYGKALADAGRLREAAEVLGRAHTPERPDWSVLSAQGSIADQLGGHEEARAYYQSALKIRPNEPTVLSNLGLSYALSKQLPQAEQTLLQAASQPAADMRVRQNLALVLALQGKFGEAEEWSRRDLTPIDAAANVASIRQMISQSNSWREIQSYGAAPNRKPTAPPARIGAVTNSATSPE